MAFNTQYLHFDSINSTYIVDPNNTTGVVVGAYKAQYSMNQSFKKLKRVYLMSVELPVGFVNIRTGSTDTLKFSVNGTPYTIVVPEKNYDSMASLCSDISTLISANAYLSSVFMSFQNDSINNKVYIKFGDYQNIYRGVTSFSITDTTLSYYILGFRGATDTLEADYQYVNNRVYKALTSTYNLSPDNFLYMYMPNFPAMNACMGNSKSTFKVALNAVNSQIYFSQEANSFKQFIDIVDQSYVFNSLTVILYDRWGKDINSHGWDFSFTIAIEYYV